MARMEPFTFALPGGQRETLLKYAAQQDITAGECLRRILAEKFAQLAQLEQWEESQ